MDILALRKFAKVLMGLLTKVQMRLNHILFWIIRRVDKEPWEESAENPITTPYKHAFMVRFHKVIVK